MLSWRFIRITLSAILIVLLCIPVAAETDNKGVIIHYTPYKTKRENYTQCAITDSYVYFTFGHESIIEVYDHNGEFQYCLVFPDRQNGQLLSICEGNRLLVLTKLRDYYYELEDDQVLTLINDPDDATVDKFDSKTTAWANKNYVYTQNENGQWEEFMPTPELVKKHIDLITVAPEYQAYLAWAKVICFLILFSFVWYLSIRKRKQSNPTVS